MILWGWVTLAAFGLGFSETGVAKPLHWELQPRQEYRLTVERVMRHRSESVSYQQTIRCQYAWFVDAVDDQGNMSLTQTLLDVRHTMQFGAEPPVVYDSSQKGEVRGDATVLARYWKNLLGSRIQQQMRANGELVPGSTESNDSETSSPTRAASNPNPPTASTSIPSSATGLSATVVVPSSGPNPAPLTNQKLLQLLVLPSDDVQPGEAWNQEREMTWPGTDSVARAVTTYTYRGEEAMDQRVFDRFDLELAWKLDGTETAHHAARLIRHSATGQLWFDADAGHVVRSEMTQDWDLEIPRENEAPVNAKSVVTLQTTFQPLPAQPEPTATTALSSGPTDSPTTDATQEIVAQRLP